MAAQSETPSIGLRVAGSLPWAWGQSAALAWMLPLAVSSLLTIPFLSLRGSLDGHEVLVAQTAREMNRTGDWIHPTFAGEPRYQKPPLAYWLTAISFRLSGDSAPSARMPSAVATVVSTLLVVTLARRTYGAAAVAARAGIIHATTLWVIGYGCSPMVDLLLATIVSAAVVLGTGSKSPSPSRVIAFWSLVGLAVLAKGPVGPAIIFLVLAAWLIGRRLTGSRTSPTDQRGLGSRRSHLIGIVIAALVGGFWPAAVLITRPDVAGLWIEQSLGRYVDRWGPATRPWYYYLYQVPFLTLPWTPLWMLALGRAILRPTQLRAEGLLWCWVVVTVLFLSLSQGKREQYVLPGLLPLAVLAAGESRRLWPLGVRTNRAWTSWPATACSAILVVGIAQCGPTLFGDSMRPLASLAERKSDLLARAPRVIQFGSNDHATAFLIDRPMRWTSSPEELRAWSGAAPNSLVLVPREHLPALGPSFGVILDSSAGASPSSEDWLLVLPSSPAANANR